MKKCHTNQCKAGCCYNVPFPRGFIQAHCEAIVTPIAGLRYIAGNAEIPVTNEQVSKNKCPFLRDDFKCNIYHERPEVCRLMATIPDLPCKWYR